MTTISLNTNENELKEFNQLCSNLGLATKTAITMFIRESIRENRLAIDSFYIPSNIEYLEKKLNGYKAGNLKLEEHPLIDN